MTKDEFDALANGIAAKLNLERQAEEPNYHSFRSTLKSQSGAAINLYWSDYGDKRLKVSINLPRSPIDGYVKDRAQRMSNVDGSEITVDPGRPVDAIAKDISRRILPRAEQLYAAALEIIEKDKAHIVKVNETLTALSLGKMKFEPVADKYEGQINGSFDDGGWITIRTSGDSATAELRSVGVQYLIRMLKAVKDRIKTKA